VPIFSHLGTAGRVISTARMVFEMVIVASGRKRDYRIRMAAPMPLPPPASFGIPLDEVDTPALVVVWMRSRETSAHDKSARKQRSAPAPAREKPQVRADSREPRSPRAQSACARRK